MSSHLDPLAYVYDADTHCFVCAEARFGRDPNGHVVGEDGEGNPVGVVSPWDEWWHSDGACEVLACGTCHGGLAYAHAAPHSPDCEDYEEEEEEGA